MVRLCVLSEIGVTKISKWTFKKFSQNLWVSKCFLLEGIAALKAVVSSALWEERRRLERDRLAVRNACCCSIENPSLEWFTVGLLVSWMWSKYREQRVHHSLAAPWYPVLTEEWFSGVKDTAWCLRCARWVRVLGDISMVGCFCSFTSSKPPVQLPDSQDMIRLSEQLITGCRILRRDYFESLVSSLFRVAYYE